MIDVICRKIIFHTLSASLWRDVTIFPFNLLLHLNYIVHIDLHFTYVQASLAAGLLPFFPLDFAPDDFLLDFWDFSAFASLGVSFAFLDVFALFILFNGLSVLSSSLPLCGDACVKAIRAKTNRIVISLKFIS